MDIQSIQNWLTKSIWGVLVLGAAGSIVGAIIIYLVKILVKKVLISKDVFLLRFIFPFHKEMERGKLINDAIGPTTKDGQFLAYYLYIVMCSFCDSVIFLLSLFLTAYVGIAYGVGRPYLLSSLIAINIIFFYFSLKSLLHVVGHLNESIYEKARQLKKQQAISFTEWKKILQNNRANR